jgi:hypothetical protein
MFSALSLTRIARLSRSLLASSGVALGLGVLACDSVVGLDKDLNFSNQPDAGGGTGSIGIDASSGGAGSGAVSGAGGSSAGGSASAGGVGGSSGAASDSGTSMSFFVSSTGSTTGGALGGVSGADKHCQKLAAAAGYGAKTWRAYLSSTDGGVINAKDRIGTGPWFNAKSQMVAASVAALHTPIQVPHPYNPGTLTLTVGIARDHMLDENGSPIAVTNQDVLTGSNPLGEATFTQYQVDALFGTGTSAPPPNCNSWTNGNPGPSAVVGHAYWADVTPEPPAMDRSWNFSHESACIPAEAGNARLYCFAID